MIALCFIVVAALIADRVLGEPPTRWHPLVWLGDAATRVEHALWNGDASARRQRVTGVVAVVAVLLIALLPVMLLSAILPNVIVAVLFLTLALGRRSLVEHANAVAEPLNQQDLLGARTALGRIVSRDTADLDPESISRATVESVLENGADAVFAAIFWTLLLGPAGAVLYRAANTLDAMWGYRNERFTHFGWAAARLDDVLNWVPARLTAFTYTALGDSESAWRAWQEHRWYSGNAGAVMASGAGALGLSLGGDARYGGTLKSRPTLGHGRAPEPQDIGAACALVNRGAGLWTAGLACAALGSLV